MNRTRQAAARIAAHSGSPEYFMPAGAPRPISCREAVQVLNRFGQRIPAALTRLLQALETGLLPGTQAGLPPAVNADRDTRPCFSPPETGVLCARWLADTWDLPARCGTPVSSP